MSRAKDWSVLRNKWIFDPRDRSLKAFLDDHQIYSVPIEEFNSAVNVLDFIIHIREKTWLTAESFYGFVEGIDYIVGGVRGSFTAKEARVPKEVLERRRIGWRIFPKPPDENSPDGIEFGPESLKEILDDEKAWIAESERICNELFEN
jgi:hypothetical protein